MIENKSQHECSSIIKRAESVNIKDTNKLSKSALNILSMEG